MTETMRSLVAGMSDKEKVRHVQEVAQDLPEKERKAAAASLSGGLFGEKPSPKIRDWLYLMVIGALVLILLAAAGVITEVLPGSAQVKNIDKVVGLFTTVLSFIVGMFVPSPVAKDG